jgi:hypothetical protein
MQRPFELVFPGKLTALASQVHRPSELPTALSSLGLGRPRPVLVLVGGADRLSEVDMARLRQDFTDALAPVAEALGATVVDGGTDAGVM